MFSVLLSVGGSGGEEEGGEGVPVHTPEAAAHLVRGHVPAQEGPRVRSVTCLPHRQAHAEVLERRLF